MLVKHYSSCLSCMELMPSIQSLTRIYLQFYFKVYKTKIAVATDCNITDQRRNLPKSMSAFLSLPLLASPSLLSPSHLIIFTFFYITFHYRIRISFSDEKGQKGFKGNN